jgi:hypothetical protein
VTVASVVSIDEPITVALSDLKTLLERAASGVSLDPFLSTLSATTTSIISAPAETGHQLRAYFSLIAAWLDRALSQPGYAASRAGTRTVEHLYDSGRALIASSNAQWAQDVRNLIDRTEEFVTALKTNRATNRFVQALDTLSVDAAQFGQEAIKSGVSRKFLQEELWKDLVGWLIPKLLSSLRSIPMPRVEFKNDTLDVAVDSLWLTVPSNSTALVPDHLLVQNWSELSLDMVYHHQPAGNDASASGGATGLLQTISRVRIHVDGIRVSAHDIGYYLKYKGLIGYEDEGLLSIDVGGHSATAVGQGLSADIDIETTMTTSRSTPHEVPSLSGPFRVQAVKVDIPGLTFSINRSKHWILNKLVLQPLAGPIVRRLLAGELERQIRSVLERTARIFGEVVEDANSNISEEANGREEIAVAFEDYCMAFLRKAQALLGSASEGTIDDGQAAGPRVTSQTTTTATLKGIMHTIVTQVEPFGNSVHLPTPEETVIAVGGGAQMFPHKGGPYDEGRSGAEPGGIADNLVDGMAEVADAVGRTTSEVVEAAVDAREEIARAEERKAQRESVEIQRRGWRSEAFDLQF